MPNSDKNLTVFSIRGSVSNKDWLLDLEMFAPSTIYNIMKMIPIIQRSESFLSEAINFFLTFPLISMGDITILKYYSDKIIEKIDSLTDELILSMSKSDDGKTANILEDLENLKDSIKDY